MNSLKQIKQAIAADPGNAENQMALSDYHLMHREYEQAAKSLRRAIRIHPENATAHNNLGACLSNLGRHLQAERSYRAAVELEPAFPSARENLAGSLLIQNRFNEATKILEDSLLIGAHTPLAFGRLAEIYLHSGQPQRAAWYSERFTEAATSGHLDCANIAEMAQTVAEHIQKKSGISGMELKISL